MTKRKDKTALQLARALKRYSDMPEPTAAFDALNREWPPAIATIITGVLWSEVELRSVKEMLADLRALQRKAVAQSMAVAAHINGKTDGVAKKATPGPSNR
jgi:hypothetical protein